jgi:hypothetical protein
MATLNANPNPVVVDNTTNPPQTSAPGVITYEKKQDEELWELRPGLSNWDLVPGSQGMQLGSHPISLRPGDQYVARVFPALNGPLTPDPKILASITVYGVLKRGRKTLIRDRTEASGGTWHFDRVITSADTRLVLIGASRTPVSLDGDGIPHLVAPDGGPRMPLPLVPSTDHQVELLPLLPGNRYFLAIMVTDGIGNWDIHLAEFNTLRRKLTVQFPKIVVFNDGDDNAFGEGDIWFRVSQGSNQINGATMLDEFHLSLPYMDDWSKTGKPYSVGFAHVGAPASVQPGQENVFAASWGVEEDGVTEPDERAGSVFGRRLPLPSGRFQETLSNGSLTLDCRPVTQGSTFHYGADVLFSVDYVP